MQATVVGRWCGLQFRCFLDRKQNEIFADFICPRSVGSNRKPTRVVANFAANNNGGSIQNPHGAAMDSDVGWRSPVRHTLHAR